MQENFVARSSFEIVREKLTIEFLVINGSSY